jgi:hypothetical protein
MKRMIKHPIVTEEKCVGTGTISRLKSIKTITWTSSKPMSNTLQVSGQILRQQLTQSFTGYIILIIIKYYL